MQIDIFKLSTDAAFVCFFAHRDLHCSRSKNPFVNQTTTLNLAQDVLFNGLLLKGIRRVSQSQLSPLLSRCVQAKKVTPFPLGNHLSLSSLITQYTIYHEYPSETETLRLQICHGPNNARNCMKTNKRITRLFLVLYALGIAKELKYNPASSITLIGTLALGMMHGLAGAYLARNNYKLGSYCQKKINDTQR